MCTALASGSSDWMANFIKTMPDLPSDPHSNAHPEVARVTHLNLKVRKIDFEKKVLWGKAIYKYEKKPEAIQIIFDVEEGMVIRAIRVDKVRLKESQWAMAETAKNKPIALFIPVQKEKGRVSIKYATSPHATGLFWRAAEMTDNKTHPMLFSQAEPMSGASFFPSQHSPQIRFTSRLTVRTGNAALMVIGSMENNPIEKNQTGKYKLKMTKPIPAYLMGFAIGNFVYSPLDTDNKTGVYSEPIKKQIAAEKFFRLPLYLSEAEELFGPYLWSVYRPVLLTLAYPYGAMEHPCASFIGGDCVDRPNIVPHELAHSWFGNLVTGATWGQIFFNEGLTCYAEYLICKVCISEDYANLSAKTRINSTLQALKNFRDLGQTEKMKLCSNMDNESASIELVPYGKGMLFFMMLEKALKIENMLHFLKDYSKTFAFQSMSKDRFLQFLKAWLSNAKITDDFLGFMEKHHIEDWLSGTEFPPNTPVIESELLNQVAYLAEKATNGEEISLLNEIISEEIRGVVFRTILSTLEVKGEISHENIGILYREYGNSFPGNDYIRGGWALLFAKRGYLTEESKPYIKKYTVERNGINMAKMICAHLLKAKEGRPLVEEILAERKSLDPSTIKAIEDTLK